MPIGSTHKRSAAVTAVFAMVILAAACGGTGGSGSTDSSVELAKNGFALNTGEARPGGTVNVLGSVDFSHLDPAMGIDGNITNFYRLIYRNLTTYANEPGDGGTKIVPDLATDTGTPNEDATEWTFTLKKGLRFEDGSPITVSDLKFGIERSFDPALAIGSNYHEIIKGAENYEGVYQDPDGLDSIKVEGDRKITFVLSKPQAAFPAIAATSPMTPFPADKVKSATQIDQQPISSGPYRVESFKRGSHVTLVRNKHWSKQTDDLRPAYPDKFKFVFGLDPNTIDQRMLAGQNEDRNAVASSTNGLLPASLARVKSDERLSQRTVQSIPACTMYMAMNSTSEPFSNRDVRRAVSYAVNKQSVVNAAGGPTLATPASDMLTPKVPSREPFDLYPSKDSKGDLTKAKALLKKAGHANGFKATMDVRGIPKWQAEAEAVQATLKKIGIEIELNVIDDATFYEVIATTSKQNDLAITGRCSGWLSGAALLEPIFHGDSITSTGNLNISQFDDPRINKRFDDVANISDIGEQDAEYAKLNREIMEQAPVVPLMRETPLQLVGENVGNAFAHAGRTGYIDYTSLGLKDPEA